MTVAISILLLLGLYLSSLLISRKVGQFFYRLTHSHQTTIYLMALFFLPGTFIHEMSHLLAATALGVRTETMELIPHLEEHGVVMGSVPVAKTDPIRRALIGAAPFLVGISFLVAVSFWLTRYSSGWPQIILGTYLSFEIANTCFASGRDMEGTLELVLVLTLITAVLYFVGINQPLKLIAGLAADNQNILAMFNKLLVIPLGINMVFLAATGLIRHR